MLAGVTATDSLVAVASHSDALREAALDRLAAERVLADVPEVGSDRAARRELGTRQEVAETAFRAEWLRLFAPRGEGGDGFVEFWYRGAKKLVPTLLPALSDMADATYMGTPTLRNELINRRNISSQAAVARRNLIEALLDNEKVTRPHLGITGFPPERSIYESVLAATGLHKRDSDGGAYFLAPPDELNDPANLLPTWRKLEELLLDATPDPRPVHRIFADLAAPQFGLTDGVLPLLLCVFLRMNDHQTTMYRENTFVPEPGIADWELLLRRPEQFAVAGCRRRPVSSLTAVNRRDVAGDEGNLPEQSAYRVSSSDDAQTMLHGWLLEGRFGVVFPRPIPPKWQDLARGVWKYGPIEQGAESFWRGMVAGTFHADLLKVAALLTDEYLACHPEWVTQELVRGLREHLPPSSGQRLQSTCPPLQPGDVPPGSSPADVLMWFKDNYLPFRRWQVLFGSTDQALLHKSAFFA